jgi:plastocyanin
MSHAHPVRHLLHACTLAGCGVGSVTVASAGELQVAVFDRDGMPVSHVVVYAEPQSNEIQAAREPSATAVMAQREHAFVPHLLVVQTGTRIEFPNTDSVSHHVYSFSAAKRFELPLYKGNVHDPLTFGVAGVVTLGCNIHDDMLGYIFVVDTPYYALTDEQGIAHFATIPDGLFAVSAWTPRLRDDKLPPAEVAAIGPDPVRLDVTFDNKLFPPHTHEGTSLSWRDY